MRFIKENFKKIILLAIVVILLVVIILVIKNWDSTKSDLKKLGYSKDQAKIIVEKLDDNQIQTILNSEYNDKLVDIIDAQYYIPNNLEEYLSFSKNENDITKVIAKVNVGANNDWYTEAKETDLSKEYGILVNKFNYLKEDFTLDDLVNISDWYSYAGQKTRDEVNKNYVNMWKAAKAENLTLLVSSSYRSYGDQKKEYDLYGDTRAARPGSSEHETGLALDLSTYNTDSDNFKNTEEYKWLQGNAYKYGFILRYPEGKEDITGYNYESWHYRYLGVTLATKVYNSGLTYDEYYAYYCEYKNEC